MKVKNLNRLYQMVTPAGPADDQTQALEMWLDCTEVTKDKILANTYQQGNPPTKQDVLVEYGSQQVMGKKLTARDFDGPGFMLPRTRHPLA